MLWLLIALVLTLSLLLGSAAVLDRRRRGHLCFVQVGDLARLTMVEADVRAGSLLDPSR